MSRTIQALAFKRATAVSLKDLFKFGSDSRPAQRLRNAQFLHNELPIRLAQRVQELNSLPYGLSQLPQIQSVQEWYTQYFNLLVQSDYPQHISDDELFTELLRTILQDHNEVIQTMALGVIELQQQLGPRGYTDLMAHRIDSSLDRFFMARIGLRFLISHHITTQGGAKPGWSGIIEEECSPRAVCEMAAEDSRYLCEMAMGKAAEIEFHGTKNSFCYVPMHLHYVMTEIIKNSLRATAEHHKGLEMPPIKVVIAHGEHDITIKVSDEGGGIPFEETQRMWSYARTTAGALPPDEQKDPETKVKKTRWRTPSTELMQDPRAVPLAGYGCGLPLSRLYTKYFGGGLQVISMEGFGTDAYVHLNRLGTKCEQLPEGVIDSPAMGTSMMAP